MNSFLPHLLSLRRMFQQIPKQLAPPTTIRTLTILSRLVGRDCGELHTYYDADTPLAPHHYTLPFVG